MLQNSKTQIVTKLKNSIDKTEKKGDKSKKIKTVTLFKHKL